MTLTLAVIAKAPVAGRVKTRLCPPCSPEQAATLAEAALADTLLAVSAADATRRVCVLDGEPGLWLPEGFQIVQQRGGGLDERLAAAFSDLGGPTFLVGMDTPQLDAELLDEATAALAIPGTDAVLGHTEDGGYWGIGLHESRDELFVGVPMSQTDTGAQQVQRLLREGLVVDDALRSLRDVDDIDDARAVAALAPRTAFAAALRAEGLADEPSAAAARPERRFAPGAAPTEVRT